jgi:hypothetical protein
VASIVPSGSHHADAPRKYTPAQNASAVAALKLGGNNPGQRLSANSARKTAGSHQFHFAFTAGHHTPGRAGFKPGIVRAPAGRCRGRHRICNRSPALRDCALIHFIRGKKIRDNS